jgi:hypothetical protein
VDSSAIDVTEHYRLGLIESGCCGLPSMLTEPPRFNHPAEEAFAKWLDDHGIAWEYEAEFFSLEEDEHGLTTRGFLPDFYLPELDLYVEITTANVGFNSRKRRKIRRAEERHGVRTILMCKTGMRGLTERYGLCYDSPRDEDVAVQSV